MTRMLKLAFDTFVSAREKHAQNRLLETLDERTLRDIGLEHQANRARERMLRAYVRFGTF